MNPEQIAELLYTISIKHSPSYKMKQLRSPTWKNASDGVRKMFIEICTEFIKELDKLK